MSTTEQNGRGDAVLRNWIIGFFAVSLWTTNYVVYFFGEIRAWYRRPRRHAHAHLHLPERRVTGPLSEDEKQPFPPPPPPTPPVRDAEIVPFPKSRRAS